MTRQIGPAVADFLSRLENEEKIINNEYKFKVLSEENAKKIEASVQRVILGHLRTGLIKERLYLSIELFATIDRNMFNITLGIMVHLGKNNQFECKTGIEDYLRNVDKYPPLLGCLDRDKLETKRFVWQD